MSDFTQTLHDLPPTSLAPVVAMIVIGLLLWIAGRKLLKFGFAMAGLLIGGVVGALIGDLLGLGVWTWVTAGVGALVLALIASIAFRMTVAVATAMIFAVAAPLGVLTYAEFKAARDNKTLAEVEFHNPIADKFTEWLQAHDNPEAREQTNAAIESAKERVSEGLDRAKSAPDLSEGTRDAIEKVEQFSKRIVEAIRSKWDSTPESLRPTLLLSAVTAALLGLIVGGLMSKLSAAAITALGGSLLWLCGAQILAVRLGVPEGPWLPASGTAWLIVWLITSVLGVVIQWTFRKRAADKPA